MGEGLTVRVQGPTRDGIRTSDSRGWNAAADIADGVVEMASASGIKSEGEHLTLETAEILVRCLNADGATWGPPVLLPDRIGRGVDCEASDTQDSRRRLKVQVTRPRMPDGFWKGITDGSSVPPGHVNEAARELWDAVVDKSPPAERGLVLAVNAIRTPWLAVPSVVEGFRQEYGEATTRDGWEAVWVIGNSEALTGRLDGAPSR